MSGKKGERVWARWAIIDKAGQLVNISTEAKLLENLARYGEEIVPIVAFEGLATDGLKERFPDLFNKPETLADKLGEVLKKREHVPFSYPQLHHELAMVATEHFSK